MEGSARVSWTPLKVLAGLAVVGALYFASQVLIPVAVALLVSLLLGPVVQGLERLRIPRVPAVVIVVALTLGLLGWTGFLVTSQVSDLAGRLPQYKDTIRVKAASIGQPLGGVLGKAYDALQDFGKQEKPGSEKAAPPVPVQIVETPPTPWEVISYLLSSVIRTLGAFALVTILVVFLLIFHSDLRDRVVLLFGVHRINITTQTINEAATTVSRYLLSQSAVNAVYGLLIGTTLAVLGVPNFLLWGCLAAVLRFIPYVGPWIGFAPPFLLTLAVYDGWSRPVAFAVVVVCLEIAIANVVEPLFYGKRAGLSPLALIIAAVFWTWLWGNSGLLLAVPLTVCLEVLGRHVPSLGFLSTMLARQTDVEPHVRFYQRLLAMRPTDASALVEARRRRASILEVCDELLLPALVLAEHDFQRGALEPDAHAAVVQGMEQVLEDLEEEPPAPTEPGLRLCCLPAAGRGDELACRMLVRVVADLKLGVEIVASGTMTAEKVEHAERLPADIACLSTLVPSGRLHAWHLYKRLRRRLPELSIVAGVWGTEEDRDDLALRLRGDSRVLTVRSLAEARMQIEQLIPEVRLRKKAASAT